jgi:hypothetical protein
MSDLKQRDGESPAQWLARLRQLGPDTLTEHERFFLLQHALDAARAAVKRQQDEASYAAAAHRKAQPPGPEATAGSPAGRPPGEEAALELCKTAYLALGPGDRERFALWMNSGCK